MSTLQAILPKIKHEVSYEKASDKNPQTKIKSYMGTDCFKAKR